MLILLKIIYTLKNNNVLFTETKKLVDAKANNKWDKLEGL